MKKLKTGDPCPCCGQPIKSKDPEVLYLLSWIAQMNHLPCTEEIGVIRRLFENRPAEEKDDLAAL